MTDPWVGLRRLIRFSARAIERDAAEMQVAPATARLLFVLPIVVTLGVAATIPVRPLYSFLIEEDRIIEWTQAILVALSAVIFFVIARRLVDVRRGAVAVLFFGAAVAMIFVAGEEISWGQRLVGWETPDAIADLNDQFETNIHNIGSLLKVFHFALMVASLAAIAAPIAWRRWAGPRRRSVLEALFVPPLFLAPGFAITFLFRFVRFTLVPEGHYVVSRFQEVTELTFYFALTVFLWLAYRRLTADSHELAAVAVATSAH